MFSKINATVFQHDFFKKEKTQEENIFWLNYTHNFFIFLKQEIGWSEFNQSEKIKKKKKNTKTDKKS